MSQSVLFIIGVGVFAITLVATLLYGYTMLDRIYRAEAAERPVLDQPTLRPLTGAVDPVPPVPAPTPGTVLPALVPLLD